MSKHLDVVRALSENKALEGHTLITEMLAEKTLNILIETKKQLVAKTWGVMKESDEKENFAKAKRKSFKEKMHKLKFGKQLGGEGKD